MSIDAPTVELRALSMDAGWSDDEAAFAELYRNHRKPVHDFLRSRDGVHTPDELEELVQEVFLRAWRNRRSFRGNSSPRTYLFGIAWNVLHEDLRAASRRPPGNPDNAFNEPAGIDPVRNPDPFGDLHRLAALIAPAMASLSSRQQEAIRLVVLEGHSLDEASQLTEASSNAVRHRVTAALDQLRRSLSYCPPDQCPHHGPIPTDCPAHRRGASCLKYEIVANL